MNERSWCPTCWSMRTIEEEFEHSEFEPYREVRTWVTRMSCGHHKESTTGETASSLPSGSL